MNAKKIPKWQVVTVLCALLLTLIACASTPTSPPPPPDNQPPAPTALQGATAPIKSELILGQLHIEPYNDNYLTYQVVAEIQNSSHGNASGFSAGCTYTCPAGDTTLSAGFDIVQGGFIGPTSGFTYKSPFHFQCQSHPPKIDLMCTIQPSDGPKQTYSVRDITLP